MTAQWQPKPGDKFFRPRRLNIYRLKRTLTVPGLFSAGYGDVGSSIYYGLGVVALAAVGLTPIALAIAGLIYVFNALTYAEGGAMIPEAGGSASFARHAFNDLIGFISGWALMLSYIVTMALSSYTIPPYLSYFWPELREPILGTAVSMGIILFLMFINTLGIKESSRMNIIFIGIDIATQVSLVILGIVFILIPHPEILAGNMFGEGNLPSPENLILGIALAALCFTGVETISQLGEETRLPAKRIPQAYVVMIFIVLILFAGISIVALSAMTPQMLADPVNGWARDPIAGIAANLPSETLRAIFAPLVAILAASILLTATNAGLMGISRLAFNMSKHQQVPHILGRVHHRFRTPYAAIIFYCFIALLLLIPGFFTNTFFAELGSLYVFGSLLCFAFAHVAIIGLRVRKAEMPRPFKLRLNIRISNKEIPLTAIMGFIATFLIWLVVIITQPFSRWVGFLWLIFGFAIYSLFRRKEHLPLTHVPADQQKPSSVQVVRKSS
jgi:APA family basic amino acid/polyamine antiporter